MNHERRILTDAEIDKVTTFSRIYNTPSDHGSNQDEFRNLRLNNEILSITAQAMNAGINMAESYRSGDTEAKIILDMLIKWEEKRIGKNVHAESIVEKTLIPDRLFTLLYNLSRESLTRDEKVEIVLKTKDNNINVCIPTSYLLLGVLTYSPQRLGHYKIVEFC